jgi:hypothetical protein
MAVGDSVRIGHGSAIHGVSTDNVPVFDLERDERDNIRWDINGCAYPRAIGGVKGGSIAKIAGDPIKVQRSYIERMSGAVKSVGGLDYIMIFPVRFDYYQQTAFVHQDHMHLIHGQLS